MLRDLSVFGGSRVYGGLGAQRCRMKSLKPKVHASRIPKFKNQTRQPTSRTLRLGPCGTLHPETSNFARLVAVVSGATLKGTKLSSPGPPKLKNPVDI